MSEAKTVLVVDDESAVRSLIRHLLEREGFQIVEAEDGEAALKYLWKTDKPPALILLDLRMPVMDGWKFRTVQRSDARIARIPVVVITSVKTAEADLNSINAQAFIKKPLEARVLLQIIESQLSPSQTPNKFFRRAA